MFLLITKCWYLNGSTLYVWNSLWVYNDLTVIPSHDSERPWNYIQTRSNEAMFITRNTNIESLDHNWIMSSIITSITSFMQCTQSAYFSSFRGGGTCHFLVINYGQHNHVCCTVSVLDVLDRLENLTTLCLVHKIIRSLWSWVTQLRVDHS